MCIRDRLNPVQFDLAQLCDEVAYRYQNICEQSGYTLTVDAADPCTVTADPDMMSRVVHNLLANAIHHIGPVSYTHLDDQSIFIL